MHNERMRVADVAINRGISILCALRESHGQLAEGDVEILLHQIHCHLCDACEALEQQNPSEQPGGNQQPGSELEEHVGVLLNLTGMIQGAINNRLSAYSEDRDADRQLWNLMGFLNKNILSEIKKIKLGGGQ
jgi:hypothetical protein